MVRITEELVRKRSEHNEGIIGTLEELSLHQEDIEKIEHLNNWCKDLQILYLQANLISKIENLNKLKKLQYLNLAVNNIEIIENLERCESLEKLDLTLNFIGDLESVASLKNNIHLRDLYLTGNPCCEFDGYRDYVIAQLPQLQNLDVQEIKRSDRIKACQMFDEVEWKVRRCQEMYRLQREEQKHRVSEKNTSDLSDDEFWKTTSENCPETRIEIARRSSKNKKGNDVKEEEKPKKKISLFNKNGRPMNINQAKLSFIFNDDNPEWFVLDVAVYKFLDTNHIDVDLQPIYVKLTIKGKIFQMVFPEEIHVERSTAERSQTTGHLVLKMPRMNYKPAKHKMWKRPLGTVEKCPRTTVEKKEERKRSREYLEVVENEEMDFSKIVENSNKVKDLYSDPEIPPLEYG